MTKHLAPHRVASAAASIGHLGINRNQANPLIQFLVVSSCRAQLGDRQVLLTPADFTGFCERWFAVPGHDERPWFVPIGSSWNKMTGNGGYPIGTLWSTIIESSAKRDQVFHAQALSPQEREVSLEEVGKIDAGLAGLVRSGDVDRRLPLRELAIWRHRLEPLEDDAEIEDLEAEVLAELQLTDKEQAILLSPPSSADPSPVYEPGDPDPAALLALLPLPQNPAGQLADLVAPRQQRAPSEVPIVDVELDERMWRVIRNAVSAFTCVLLVGPPGTGKGQILARIAQEVAQQPELYGFDGSAHGDGWPDPVVKTPHEGWQTFDLVGGPIVDPEAGLRWSAGFMLDAIRDDRWVVLDETNRGDLDKIMGPLITWLAGGVAEIGVTSTRETRRSIQLGWTDDAACRTIPPEGVDVDDSDLSTDVEYRAGKDWRLLGSFNPQDAQRVFAIGQALGRRFKSVPVAPLEPAQFEDLLTRQFPGLPGEVVRKLKLLYGAHLDSEDGLLGPALFLDAARYVARSLPTTVSEDPGGDDGEPAADAVAGGDTTADSEVEGGLDADGEPPVEGEESTSGAGHLDELIAEGYLVTVGRFLANLDPAVLAELRTNSGDALDEDQWEWIAEGLKALAL